MNRIPPEPALKHITVLLADDHNIIRQGLRLVLLAEKDILVVGEAENGHEAVAAAQRLRPNVVVIDLSMPLLNGVEATRQIIKAVPTTKVLILSSYRDDMHVQQAIEAGAAGYVLKETAGNDVCEGVREVQAGNAYFSPLVSKGLQKQWQGGPGPQAKEHAKLSMRQMEVLQLIAEGHGTKNIADLLSITHKTVERHRQALMDALNIHKIAGLTLYAISNGMIEAEGLPTWRTALPVEAKKKSALTKSASRAGAGC